MNNKGKGELINAADRFGKRRLDAIIIPTPPKTSSEVIPIRPVRDAERLLEISRIYNESVDPIVNILQEHGYEREAMLLSHNASEALWLGANSEQVKEQVEQDLLEIDPVLQDLVLGKPENLDS